jgi:membrane-bound lytic murein transglycosylase MltF
MRPFATPPAALAAGGLAVLLLAVACSGPEAENGPPPEEPAVAADSEAAPAAPAADPTGPSFAMPEEFVNLWRPRKGDLDEIVERRRVRVLVTFNATSYFVDLGRQGGITYEFGRLLEKELNRRFQKGNLHLDVVFLPVNRDRLIPALAAGYGDIAAANLTVTEDRQRRVDFTTPLNRRGVQQVLVTGPGAPAIERLEDLSGQEVFVRRSSAFYESLEELNASFRERGLDPVRIEAVSEDLETEDILELTNAGVYPITVADNHLVDLWSQVLPNIRPHRDVVLKTGTDIAWAIRQDSPKLEAFLNEFLRKNREGTLVGNMLINRYLRKPSWIKNPGSQRDAERFRSMVSLFEKYGDQYDFDYLLITAQAYQESGLDHSKRSGAGAIGVMQMLPSTARDPNVGIADITSLENNVHAGVKYLRFILDRYFADAKMDEVNRHLFAFASYNAGPARVAGLRWKAEQMGLDPNVWRGNVEVVAAREIGRETVTYVANILKYYAAYRLIQERSRERQQTKSVV